MSNKPKTTTEGLGENSPSMEDDLARQMNLPNKIFLTTCTSSSAIKNCEHSQQLYHKFLKSKKIYLGCFMPELPRD